METILGLLSVIYQQLKALRFLVVVLIQKLSKENKISSKLPRRILIIVVISLQFFFNLKYCLQFATISHFKWNFTLINRNYTHIIDACYDIIFRLMAISLFIR